MAASKQGNKGGSEREQPDVGIEDNPGRESPEKWQGPKDIRGEDGAGEYPNQVVWKSRSGNSFAYDDSEGKESMTIQHRSGSAMQFLPNGAVHLVSHHGLYQIVFGEKRLTVTGAQDMTIKGDGSMRVYGHYNKTIHGDKNETITGSHNMTAENVNHHVRGNMDVQARNKTVKIAGNSSETVKGAKAIVAGRDLTVASQKRALHLGGAAGIHGQADNGDITMNTKKGSFHMGSEDGEFNLKVKNAIKLMSDDGSLHAMIKDQIQMMAKNGDIKVNAQQGNIKVAADSGSTHIDAGNEAAMQGKSGTYVESSSGSVHVKASAGNFNADAMEHQWQGGMAQSFSPPSMGNGEEAETKTGESKGGIDERTEVAQLQKPWGNLS